MLPEGVARVGACEEEEPSLLSLTAENDSVISTTRHVDGTRTIRELNARERLAVLFVHQPKLAFNREEKAHSISVATKEQ